MKGVIAALLLVLVTGCATAPPVVPDLVLVSPQAGYWTLRGRIGIQTGEQSLSGQIHWHHRADADEVLMTSPLGQGVARIVRDADGVMLEVPNQPSRRAADAESLTREVLGYALPVSGLVWWVQAIPDPGSRFEATHDATGRLTRLKQHGWVIDYLQYAIDEPARLRKLTVTREGLEIRLIADSWHAE